MRELSSDGVTSSHLDFLTADHQVIFPSVLPISLSRVSHLIWLTRQLVPVVCFVFLNVVF